MPDQAQVRVLGRVTAVRSGGRVLEVEADGMPFTAELKGRLPITPVKVGDRVILSDMSAWDAYERIKLN